MDLGLQGKKALVLGASRGLGAAIAKVLAAEGASVFGAARDTARIDELGREASANGAGSIASLPLDLSKRDSIDAIIQKIEALGGVDIVVNNSGGPTPGEARSVPADQWASAFES